MKRFIYLLASLAFCVALMGAATSSVDTITGNFVGGSITASNLSQISTNNDNAPSGALGEFVNVIVPSGSAVSLVNSTYADVFTISLTPGDWDVEGSADVIFSSVIASVGVMAINTAANTNPNDGTDVGQIYNLSGFTGTGGATVPRKRISIAVNTTVRFGVQVNFSAGTAKACGNLSARRVR